MPKILFIALLGLFLSVQAQIAPTRVGPVSQYGKLITGKNNSGKGQIYGSCDGVISGKEVQVKGMSVFWSVGSEGYLFYNDASVSKLVSDMKIQIIRAAIGTDDKWGEDVWNSGYILNPSYQKALLEAVIESAIKNDVYVIIDWHSHKADKQTNEAKAFFSEMAQKYGKYDNVIFEIFNEPESISWSTIKSYADVVVAEIRNHSSNLIIVGTPKWDQEPHTAIGNALNYQNIAYAFHYYAGSHCYSGKTSWGSDCEGTNAVKAMNAGLSVFVSEWGTVNANGDGNVASSNDGWQDWMDSHKLSWANWSVSNKAEGASIFGTNATATDNWNYTASGNYVKQKLASNPSSYTSCHTTSISKVQQQSGIQLNALTRGIRLSASQNSSIQIQVFDMLGQSVFSKNEHFNQGTYIIPLENIAPGNYIVKAKNANQVQTISLQIQ